MRDNDGVVHSVPNGEIQVASNFTRIFARVNERFAVAAGTDIERATRVLNEVCAALAAADDGEGRFIEPPRVLRVDAAVAGDSGIPILVTATVRPGEQWEIAGELRRRAIEALGAARIDLAAGRTLLVSGALEATWTRRTTPRAMPSTRDRKDRFGCAWALARADARSGNPAETGV